MTKTEKTVSKSVGDNMMKLLTAKEVAAVRGAAGPVPSGGPNPTKP